MATSFSRTIRVRWSPEAADAVLLLAPPWRKQQDAEAMREQLTPWRTLLQVAHV